MRTEVEWIPCAERLPDDEELVLLAKDGECWLGWHDGDEWLADDAAPLSGVTHWARMPEVPCAAETGSEPRRIGPDTPDDNMVICPHCTSQFGAIPVNVQARLRAAERLLRDVIDTDDGRSYWKGIVREARAWIDGEPRAAVPAGVAQVQRAFEESDADCARLEAWRTYAIGRLLMSPELVAEIDAKARAAVQPTPSHTGD